MKKTSTLIAALLLSVIMYAFPNQSKLSISSVSNQPVRVMIDGNKYKASNNSLVLSNLSAGYHNIKVYQLKNGNRNNPYSNYQLLYSASIYIKQQFHVDITINRFGKAFVDEQLMTGNYHDEDEEDDWADNNNNDNWNNGNGYNTSMNNQSFDQFKQTLSNESFENTRMTIAKQVMTNNSFTTAQVKELLQLFSFENNKLELAKFAYKYTLDKRNYFSLNDVFTFSSNKEALMRYVQSNS